jgi:hypothetical protein
LAPYIICVFLALPLTKERILATICKLLLYEVIPNPPNNPYKTRYITDTAIDQSKPNITKRCSKICQRGTKPQKSPHDTADKNSATVWTTVTADLSRPL